MTREEVLNKAVSIIDINNIILELSTGFGKTKLSIDLLKHIKADNILVVVAKTVHKNEWKREFKKWGFNKTPSLECYNSLDKHIGIHYDAIVFDEAHHLYTELRLEIFEELKADKFIFLSATLKRDFKDYLKVNKNTKVIKSSLQESIDSGVLPEPKIYLIPLTLDNKKSNCEFTMNSKGKQSVYSNYKDRFTVYNRNPKHKIKVRCTEYEYNNYLDSTINYYKNKTMRGNRFFKQRWLMYCNKRLKWLSDRKTEFIKTLLNMLGDRRKVIFCSSIKQAEEISMYSVTTKNINSSKNYDNFNNNRINTLSACNILNEGVNLVNCQIGIYGNINASEVITKQRMGRLLRHKNPVVFIPYYQNTREEELVKKMLEEYNSDIVYILPENKIKLFLEHGL